jgi:hypothetical protein
LIFLLAVRFDGTNLYSTSPITCLNKEWTFEIDNEEYQVRLEKCDQITEASADEELRQVLNVVFRQALGELYTRIGTEYFDTSAPMVFEDRFREFVSVPSICMTHISDGDVRSAVCKIRSISIPDSLLPFPPRCLVTRFSSP